MVARWNVQVELDLRHGHARCNDVDVVIPQARGPAQDLGYIQASGWDLEPPGRLGDVERREPLDHLSAGARQDWSAGLRPAVFRSPVRQCEPFSGHGSVAPASELLAPRNEPDLADVVRSGLGAGPDVIEGEAHALAACGH